MGRITEAEPASSAAVEVHLVRHGPPAIEDQLPADQWALATAARPELDRLRATGRLPAAARWFSSPEPKAMETARALTRTSVGVVDGLREMYRPAGPMLGAEQWRATVTTAMSEPDVPARPGWEPATATAERVSGAVRRIRDSCDVEPIVLVGHGTAWTLLVARLTRTPPDVAAWARLGMPDHCVLTFDQAADTARVTTGWGQWAGDGSPAGAVPDLSSKR